MTKPIDKPYFIQDNPATMPHYLDPKSDLVFKKIFGHHPELLKSFLNSILPLPKDCIIESLTYLPTESVPELVVLKHSIVDVLCLDNHGRHFIVEMQLQWTSDFIKRMLYNTAATYVRRLKKGDGYQELAPVYGLALIDANFTQEEEWFHHYRMAKVDHPENNLEDIQLVLIELPKFKPNNIIGKRLAVLWLRFLKEINEETEVVDPSLLEVDSIKEAVSLLETSSYTLEELRAYEKGWDAVSTEKTLIRGKFEEGKAEGLAEGLAKGQAAERKHFITSMHRSGIALEQICQITQLSKEEVEELICVN